MAIPFSILDLAPIVEGGTAASALQNTLDFARHAERYGYHRYWLAEHHNMPGIASAATAILIAHVAGGTRSIRVGLMKKAAKLLERRVPGWATPGKPMGQKDIQNSTCLGYTVND